MRSSSFTARRADARSRFLGLPADTRRPADSPPDVSCGLWVHQRSALHPEDLVAEHRQGALVVADDDRGAASRRSCESSPKLPAATETSSAEVGSSATSSRGSATRARMIAMRWHCPPERRARRASALTPSSPTSPARVLVYRHHEAVAAHATYRSAAPTGGCRRRIARATPESGANLPGGGFSAQGVRYCDDAAIGRISYGPRVPSPS